MKKENQKILKRKTFDEIISNAFIDYLNGGGYESNGYGGFSPGDTPNRNPEQVNRRIWSRLLWHHLDKYFYN